MKGLFLCGANITSMIWAKTLDKFKFRADVICQWLKILNNW